MENASKALIIAGAILLAILIIGLGVFIYRQAAGVIDTGAMDQLAVNQFNAQFEPYLNNNVSGSNVKQLVKTIVSSNRSAEDDSKKVTINGCEVTRNNFTSYYKSGTTYSVQVEDSGYSHSGLITNIIIKEGDTLVPSGNTEIKEEELIKVQ